jgi:YHS domain-containing protein
MFHLSIGRARAALLLSALVVPAAWAGVANPNRTLSVDAVSLVTGTEVPGLPEHAVTHRGFTYLFASSATREQFMREPSRYEVQLDGTCARMGPLGGSATTEHRHVHDGKLYIFASPQCRETFVKRAADLLESADAPPEASAVELERGRELVDLATKGLGGAARLDGVLSYQAGTHERAEHEGALVDVVDVLTVSGVDRHRIDSAWGQWHSVYVVTPGEGFAVEEAGTSELCAARRQAVERRVLRHLVPLLRSRHDRGFLAAARGASRVGDGACERVAVHVRGVTVLLDVELATGRVLAATYRGHGPGGFLGTMTETYSEHESVAGLMLPRVVTRTFEGRPFGEPLRRNVLAIDAWFDPALFRRM